MAEQELVAAVSSLPKDAETRLVVFTETVRSIDYWSVFQPLLPKEQRLTEPDFDILQWGWNLAAAHLYSPLQTLGAFPLMESTTNSRSAAASLLHRFGRSVLLRRAAEMIQFGILKVEKNGGGYILRIAENLSSQFLDILEFSRLEDLERTINELDDGKVSKGWAHFDTDDLARVQNLAGNYFLRDQSKPLKDWLQPDIDSLMLPLIRPWNSGRGIMMGYGAEPEVDYHFLAEATKLALEWRTEAGFHPQARIEEITAGELTIVIALIASLHFKHLKFALLAPKRHPEISVPQSLTIWGPRKELEQSIVDFCSLDASLVRKAVDALALRPNDVYHLNVHTTPFRPLLIDMGNGLVLHPVSSVTRNPFSSVRALQEWRDPQTRNRLSAPREDWMRSEIYSLFQGSRYSCVGSSIKLRQKSEVVTDIDAAVFDQVTGELALFQIKWQDFSTNDIRQLRSKASNFAVEMDAWAEKVEQWATHIGSGGLAKALRLKLRKGVSISAINLFGVSRTAARLQGFGFAAKHPSLALANWPQFVRVRYEIGPTDHVFQKMHRALKNEADATVKTSPLPKTISVAGRSIQFVDLWNAVDDSLS